MRILVFSKAVNGTFKILISNAGGTPLYIDKACVTVYGSQISNDGIHWESVNYEIAYCVPTVAPPSPLIECAPPGVRIVHKEWMLHPGERTISQ